MDGGNELTPERVKEIETRWKSDVDMKLDKMIAFMDEYEWYLQMCLEREKDRKTLRRAIIEKSSVALLVMLVGALVAITYEAFKRWIVSLK